jgi:hypothetical protein
MTIIMPVLVLVYFFLYLYLKLRKGPEHFPWPALIFMLIYMAIAITTRTIENYLTVVFPILFIPVIAGIVAFGIQRKRAGNRILTYKRTASNVKTQIVSIVFILLMGYLISIPNVRTYPGGEPVYDETFYHERLPASIIIALIGLAFIPLIFRKGEIFETGIATPDLNFLPWSGYQAYKWLENANKKSDDHFSLFLKINMNYSRTIHGFSETTKSILEELLSTKLEKIPELKNSELEIPHARKR